MATTGDHNSGELQHPAALRSGLRSWIDSVLGPERRRAIFVNVMPSANTVDTWSEKEHATRTRSFCIACLCLVVAGMAFLEIMRLMMNAIISHRLKRSLSKVRPKPRPHEPELRYLADLEERVPPAPVNVEVGPDSPLLSSSDADPEARRAGGQQEEAADSDVKDELAADSDVEDELVRVQPLEYVSRDLFFATYHGVYSISCLAVTGYALQGECLSTRFGLDYEFYLLWVVYIIGLHIACLCYVYKLAFRKGQEIASCWMAIPKSFDAAVGHLGVLRDAVTAGLFAQELTRRRGWDAVVLALITLVSAAGIFLPNVWIFPALHALRDFEETYWPIIAQADRQFSQPQFSQSKRDAAPETPELGFIERTIASIKDFWAKTDKKKIVLEHLEKGTRLHKQATSILGDYPQAICGTIFLVRYSRPEGDLFVFLSTLISFTKFHTILKVLFLRAPTLILMTNHEMEWRHLTPADIRQGILPVFSYAKWPFQSAACRRLLKNPETTIDARIEALRSLHKLHHSNSEYVRRRRDMLQEELAMLEDERMEARHACLWEVAQHPDPRVQRIAKEFLDHDNKEHIDWKTAAMQLRRLVNDVPGEKMEAMKLLTTDYPQYSPAYAGNLLEDLSRMPTKALNRAPVEAQGNDVFEDNVHGVIQGALCAHLEAEQLLCCPSSVIEEDGTPPEETPDQKDKLAFAEEWRSMRELRYASAKALADLATMSKYREGDKKGPTEDQRRMALRAIKSVAPAVVERLDSNKAEISSAALVAVVAFRSQEEIEMAVKKAVELLKGETKGTAILLRNRGEDDCRRLHTMKEEKRRTAELVLVQLLPELNLESEKEIPTMRGQEYWLDQIVSCGFDSKWARKPEAVISRRVLERLGGRTAGLAKERLLRRSDLDLQGKDLLQVLEAQEKDLQDMYGDWRLCRSMNLKLAPGGISRLNTSDLEKIAAGEEIFEVLSRKSLAYHMTTHDDPDPNRPEDDSVTHVLPVFFTDLEPDDTLFIAEMWKFLRKEEERTGQRRCCEPMVIFATNPDLKDVGMIFEKKITLAALVLGKVDYRVLTPSPKASKPEKDGMSKDRADKKTQRIVGLRDRNIKAIQERLRRFRGHVDFFVSAPGRGNLGEIIFGPDTSDGQRFADDLMKGKTFSVALYSGQFNINYMEPGDLAGVRKLQHHDGRQTGKKEGKMEALMDTVNFSFWGGKETHPAADSLSTFALPSFAPKMKCKYPEIAYLWLSFNDEFNCKLIHHAKLFDTVVLGPKMAEIKGLYDTQQTTKYAQRILEDDELFNQVQGRKKLIVKNFAYGCCDAPIGDQLVFVARWASIYQQFSQLWTDQEADDWEPSWVRTVKGKWHVDKDLMLTMVDTKSTLSHAPDAVQPEIQFPCNVMAIYKISEALQDYTLSHLQDLRTEQFKLTPQEAKQIKVIT